VQGKELSFNNIADADAALDLVAELAADGPAVVIVKHANPCGVALGNDLTAAYRKALACDPVSAFGGIVAVSRRLDEMTAREIAKLFTEVVIAPDADDAALAVFAAKANLRVLLTGALPDPRQRRDTVRSIAGGLLVQTRDWRGISDARFEVVTKRQPTAAETRDLRFAFTVAKHVKSNAIVYAKDGTTVGIGAGQMSRIDSARIAAWKAADAAKVLGADTPLTVGSVAASEAFFPFADGLEAIAAAGATAVIQPGGSVKDADVIAAADRLGLAMVFTSQRHFRH
jgi:phosphoribosylaminoimidazolecarboxamide formyltransferase / IMP cyclohydrolase